MVHLKALLETNMPREYLFTYNGDHESKKKTKREM